MDLDLTQVTNFLQNPDFLIGVLTGLLAAILVGLIFSLLRRQPEMFEAFSNDAGKVLVSRHALQEQVQRCCEELDDVGKCRVTVIQRNNVLSTRVHLRLRSNAKLVGISGYLQEQIERVVRNNLGVENIGPIDIIVTGILPAASQEKATRITPEDKAAQ